MCNAYDGVNRDSTVHPGIVGKASVFRQVRLQQQHQRKVMTFRNGLDSLFRPEDSVLFLTDHQAF
jgi:hypothetical protein